MVKSTFMEGQTDSITISPPKLFESLTVGFNTVTNNLHLVIPPLVLDLFLWLGPHLRIRDVMMPLWEEYNRMVVQMGDQTMIEWVGQVREMYDVLLTRFNLFSMLRTYPVGVSSLLSAYSPVETPLGQAVFLETTSVGAAVGLWVLLALAGLFLGALYFQQIGRVVQPVKAGDNTALKDLFWHYLQMVSLTLITIVFMVIMLIPISLMVVFVAMINPGLVQISLFLMGLMALWLLMPLVFSPHGVFAYRLSAPASMLTSLKLVRFFLPGTGLFLLIVLLISQGMDVIWRIPPESSWLLLVGVVGHAFVSTALVSSSFVYYTGGMRWMQESLRKGTGNPTAAFKQ